MNIKSVHSRKCSTIKSTTMARVGEQVANIEIPLVRQLRASGDLVAYDITGHSEVSEVDTAVQSAARQGTRLMGTFQTKLLMTI